MGGRKQNWIREILSPEEARAEFPRLWGAAEWVVPGLTDDQLARVISLVVDTCPTCHAADRRCPCRAWDDRRPPAAELGGPTAGRASIRRRAGPRRP